MPAPASIRSAEAGFALDPVQWLRVLAVLCVVMPLFICTVFGIYRYGEVNAQAAQRVTRSLRVAKEHADKVIAGVESVQDRLLDQINGRPAPELRSAQAGLHELLQRYVNNQPQIQSIWVIDAKGGPIVSSRFRIPPAIDVSDRPYFIAHRQGGAGRYLSPPLLSRTTNQKIIDFSVRIDAADGSFGGVVNISLLADYFQRFYSDLVADEPGLAINLFREDGAIYTRWPLVTPEVTRLGPGSPVMESLRRGSDQGQFRGISSVDGQDRWIAYAKVAGYPLYLGTGMNISVLRQDLLRDLGLLLLLSSPPFAFLLYAATIAARRTRESITAAQLLSRETHTRLQAEEALLQAQKLEALGRLTGGVAHDFNNALMVISSSAALLRKLVPEAGLKSLDTIQRAVGSSTQLTRQLLAFSRKQALAPERVKLSAWLPEVKTLLEPVLGSRARVSLSIAPDTSDIRVDRSELELALLNLAINARDAMPAGGEFRIAAFDSPDSAQVVLEVADTGEGIAEPLIDKVFEPFFTTKPVGQGTGLGLSQVYGFCTRAGGKASIASRPGEGTTVTMSLPRCAAGDGTEAQAPSPPTGPIAKTLLLVEDNHDVALSLTEWLVSLGCEVERADRAADALTRLQKRVGPLPDFVLTDVVMPGEMDGVELAKTIRRQWPALPVLIMTGYAQEIEAIEKAGFEVVPKPFSLDILRTAISRITVPAAG